MTVITTLKKASSFCYEAARLNTYSAAFSVTTAGLVLSTVAFSMAPAEAVSITINNPSFESPSLTPANSAEFGNAPGYFFNYDPIDSWASSGDYVGLTKLPDPASNPPNPVLAAAPNGGNQVAYANNGNIFQQLTATLLNNTDYLLNVFVGARTDLASPSYLVELLAGNTVLAAKNNVALVPGQFVPVSVAYSSGINNPLAGQNLSIRLTSFGPQTSFDMVTLSANPVPTPALVPGAIAFAASLLRKRKSELVEDTCEV